jgi:hypothetical protein
MSGTVVPPLQQASQLRRGNTETIRSFQNPVAHATAWPWLQPLYPVNEVQDYSPADYLSQSPELTSTPYVSVTLSPTLERGELQAQDFSYLSTSSRSDFTWPMPYSSSPPTSDAGLMIASTATSSAMSYYNTDDVLSGTIGMLRVDSSASHCNYSVASDSTIVDAYKVDNVAAQTFPQSSMSSLDENSVVSQSQTSLLDNQSFVSFPSQTEMKRLPSEESNASSLSWSSQSRLSRRVSEQNAQSKARPLAPKRECRDDSSSTKAKIPEITEVTSDDGTIRHKAEMLCAEEERVLKELLLGKECSVCGEPTIDLRAAYGALTPSCTHKWSVVICREDLQTYLATRITPEDGRVSSSILCWAPNCNAILRHHDIQQHANIQDFEAYDDALLQQAIHASESFAECSTSGCRGGGWVDSTSNITYFVCGLCHRTTCIEHNGPYETHAGKPCPATAGRRAQTEQERERREEDRASEELLKKTAQLGPCGHWVSKIGGCDHMTCACLSSLCWEVFLLPFLSFPFYPFKRRYEDKGVFADIISANQVNHVVVSSATSAARTTST